MSEPTLADVVTCLDGIKKELAELVVAVKALATVPAAPTAERAKPTQSEPPRSGGPRAPATPTRPIVAAAQAAKAPTKAPAAAEMSNPDPAHDDPDLVLPPGFELPGPTASLETVVQRFFEACLIPEDKAAWPVLEALTHSRQLLGPRALDNLKAFNWRKARRSLDRYLVDLNPASFEIVRLDPAEPDVDDLFVKVFLHQINGSPSPLHMRRDDKRGGAWRIEQVSV